MSPLELVTELTRRGAVLWAEGERLRYRAPEGSLDESLRTQLGAEKQEVLNLLRHDPTKVRSSYPLSNGQQALWFLYRLDPDSAAYNTILAARSQSSIDLAVLRRAFAGLAERHAVLRSTFSDGEGIPMQHVHDVVDISLEEVDGNAWSDKELASWLSDEARQPFDLERGPIWRATLIRQSGERRVLVLVVHHIATDVLSFMVLVDELRIIYPAVQAGMTAKLAVPEAQYSDYVLRQALWLRGAEGEKLWNYWREKLSGKLPVLNLPTDRSRPAFQTYRGASHGFSFADGLMRAVRKMAEVERATPSAVLLAAFATVLHRYSGQEEILIGSPTTGRTEAEFARVVGFFANAVVLRLNISKETNFIAVVKNAHLTLVEAQLHQGYPFARLVERLQPQRDPSRSPLFQVSFTLDKANWAGRLADSEAGLQLVPMAVSEQEGQFDLALQVIERGESFSAYLKYNTDLYEEATVERMAGHYVRLLESSVAQPGRVLSELSMLTEPERRQICQEWNQTAKAPGPIGLIHQLVEEQAARAPERIALVFAGQTLNYAELNRRANQLAHHLRLLGVGPETLVGISLERSMEMVMAVLGVLKAGGAYVPMDPSYPHERLAILLEDSGAKVLLTQEKLAGKLPAHQARTLCLDSEWSSIAQNPATNLELPVEPPSLAYVIYTSGSTGRPKGVQVTHRSVVNFLDSMQVEPGMSPEDVLLAVTSLSFDIAGLELFLPLSLGAKVVLASQEAAADGAELLRLLSNSEPTIMQATPVTWRLLLGAGWSGSARLKVLCGGEAMPRELAAALLPKSKEVWNMYGPTETTIWSTLYRVCPREGGVSIGRPIANTQVYVLDHNLNPVPVGVPGELYIGGVGLARGYLHRPELTAERFIRNPFNDDPRERLYKTGDSVRYRPDGNLEFYGRLDDQVKVRGYRIELGDVESALQKHPQVKEAVVVVRPDGTGENRLIAYLVMQDPAALTELAGFLRTKLPAYMVPAVFVPLASFPVTPNGKVDRRALPEPAPVRPQLAVEFTPPRNPLEELLARTYATVLGLDRVGIHDNFFELGGHSLLAMQVHARLRNSVNQELPLHALFEAPTPARLAELIQSSRRDSKANLHLEIRPGPHPETIPLSFSQERLWILEQLAPTSPAYNLPEAFRLTGSLDRNALRRSFGEVLRRHEILRSTISARAGKPVQRISGKTEPPLDLIDLRTLPVLHAETEARRLIRREACKPFDLDRGPLFRSTIIQITEKDHWVVFTVHHIVADGWSMGILVREIGGLYNAYIGGGNSPLSIVPIQYSDYAQWQRQWFQGDVRNRQLDYWRQQLRGSISPLQLPTDRTRPAVQSYRGARLNFNFPAALTGSLRALAQREGATLFMVLLAGFKALWWKYTGQTDILVGTPTANRNRREVEDLIGLFLNMLVLRTDLGGDPSFSVLLGRVRRTALEAYDHQDMPFEQLVEELQPKRDRSRSPLFQVAFALQNIPYAPLQLSGLEVCPLEVGTGTSKFDLSVAVTETFHGMFAVWEYNTDLYEEATVERMAGHYVRLLESSVAQPGRALSELSMLTEPERRQICREWNQTAKAPGPIGLIHQLVEEQAARAPERIALVFAGQTLNYAELNRRANQLAHHLRLLGVGPETLVGISLERSMEMVMAVLGVLKAGGAYVPMDPSYPHERLAILLEDSGAKVLLTQEKLAGKLPAHQARTLCLDSEWSSIAQNPATNLELPVEPPSLAYVIYTSGSTGRPKGVQVTHRSVVNFLDSMQVEPGMSPEDVLLAVTSLSFDIAGLELFLPLSLGAKVVLASQEAAADGAELLRLLSNSEPTIMQATPVTWRLLLGAGWSGSARLKVLCGGEAMPRELAAALLPKSKEVWNMYGPTETTIWSTLYRVCPREGGVSIGRPIANTQVYVLDHNLNPVPVGVPGELYIGGVGLARGYLHRPELTAERFIRNPFNDDPRERLYKTGDSVRYRPDGNLEFYGRLDDQVKVRGYRIELGDVESALQKHPQVKEAVVVVRPDGTGENRLIAYLVMQDPAALTELAGFLRTKLPAYMVPAVFVPLASFPVTPNGKVDRRALPEPAPVRPQLAVEFTPPRNPLEELLARTYATVLGLDRVGIHDNFFELGGASLSSLQITANLHEAGVPIPPAWIFEHQTIAELAAAASTANGDSLSGPLVREQEPAKI